MTESPEHSVEVTIQNEMGFHVRPVQRFASLARLFNCEVEVSIRDRRVPGKSVINLVSLGGRLGDTMRIVLRGEDAPQAAAVLKYLAENRFFVEDHMDMAGKPNRHVERLARMASFFRSDVKVTVDGRTADGKDPAALLELGFAPTEAPQFEVCGEDAEQARALLEELASSCFYVEDQMAKRPRSKA